jgi:hypothetical protein
MYSQSIAIQGSQSGLCRVSGTAPYNSVVQPGRGLVSHASSWQSRPMQQCSWDGMSRPSAGISAPSEQVVSCVTALRYMVRETREGCNGMIRRPEIGRVRGS